MDSDSSHLKKWCEDRGAQDPLYQQLVKKGCWGSSKGFNLLLQHVLKSDVFPLAHGLDIDLCFAMELKEAVKRIQQSEFPSAENQPPERDTQNREIIQKHPATDDLPSLTADRLGIPLGHAMEPEEAVKRIQLSEVPLTENQLPEAPVRDIQNGQQDLTVTVHKSPDCQRFRYPTELKECKQTSKLSQASLLDDKEAFLEIQLGKDGRPYLPSGKIEVNVWTVNPEPGPSGRYFPHPYSLRGDGTNEEGVYCQTHLGNQKIRIPSLQIIMEKLNDLVKKVQCMDKDNLPENLRQLPITRDTVRKAYNLDSVRLLIQVSLPDYLGQCVKLLTVVTKPINHTKSFKEKKIEIKRLSLPSAPAKTKTILHIMGENMQLANKVVFDDKCGWHEEVRIMATFGTGAVEIETPEYTGASRSASVDASLYVEGVVKKSGQEIQSQELVFTFINDEYNIVGKAAGKVKKNEIPSTSDYISLHDTTTKCGAFQNRGEYSGKAENSNDEDAERPTAPTGNSAAKKRKRPMISDLKGKKRKVLQKKQPRPERYKKACTDEYNIVGKAAGKVKKNEIPSTCGYMSLHDTTTKCGAFQNRGEYSGKDWDADKLGGQTNLTSEMPAPAVPAVTPACSGGQNKQMENQMDMLDHTQPTAPCKDSTEDRNSLEVLNDSGGQPSMPVTSSGQRPMPGTSESQLPIIGTSRQLTMIGTSGQLPMFGISSDQPSILYSFVGQQLMPSTSGGQLLMPVFSSNQPRMLYSFVGQQLLPCTSGGQLPMPVISSDQPTILYSFGSQQLLPSTSGQQQPMLGISSDQPTMLGSFVGQQLMPSTSGGQQSMPVISSDQPTMLFSFVGQQLMPDTSGGQQSMPVISSDQPTMLFSFVGQQLMPDTSGGQQSMPVISSDQPTMLFSFVGQQLMPSTLDGQQLMPSTSDGQQPMPSTSDGQQLMPGISSDLPTLLYSFVCQQPMSSTSDGQQPMPVISSDQPTTLGSFFGQQPMSSTSDGQQPMPVISSDQPTTLGSFFGQQPISSTSDGQQPMPVISSDQLTMLGSFGVQPQMSNASESMRDISESVRDTSESVTGTVTDNVNPFGDIDLSSIDLFIGNSDHFSDHVISNPAPRPPDKLFDSGDDDSDCFSSHF